MISKVLIEHCWIKIKNVGKFSINFQILVSFMVTLGVMIYEPQKNAQLCRQGQRKLKLCKLIEQHKKVLPINYIRYRFWILLLQSHMPFYKWTYLINQSVWKWVLFIIIHLKFFQQTFHINGHIVSILFAIPVAIVNYIFTFLSK